MNGNVGGSGWADKSCSFVLSPDLWGQLGMARTRSLPHRALEGASGASARACLRWASLVRGSRGLGSPGLFSPSYRWVLRPEAAAHKGPVPQDRTPKPPSDLCPHTLFHQLLGPTSSQGPSWGRKAASGPRQQEAGQAGARGQGWWVPAGSQREAQSRLQALGLRLGSGSLVSWVGGCRVAGPACWGELDFCTRGRTTARRPGPAWCRSPALGRGPEAPVGFKGAGALGSVPQRRHGGQVALILSRAARGWERLSLSTFCSGGEFWGGSGLGGSGSASGRGFPGEASSLGFSGLGLADLVSSPGPGSWCLPRKTPVTAGSASSGGESRDGPGPRCWRKGFSGIGGGLEKPRRLPARPGQGEEGRGGGGMSTSQLGTSGGTVQGTSESSGSCRLSWSSAAAAAAATASGHARGPRDLRKGGRTLGLTARVGGSLRRRHVCGKREGRLSEPRRLGPSSGEGKGDGGGPSRPETRRGDRGSRSDRGRRGRGEKGGWKGPARMEGWGDAGPKGER